MPRQRSRTPTPPPAAVSATGEEGPFAAYRLGEQDERLELSTRAEQHDAALALAAQARRTVHLVSRHLDPPIYDREPFVAALTRMLLASRRARVRILIQDPTTVVRRGHRLLGLTQRLPSYVEIRVPTGHHERYPSAFLVVDAVGVVMREIAERYEGTLCFRDRRQARQLIERFDDMWATARLDPGLRRLHL